MMSRSTLTGILASSIVHIGLLSGFYLLQFEFEPEEPKFISLNFAEVSGSLFEKIPPATGKTTEQRSLDQDVVRLPESRFYTEDAPIPAAERENAKQQEKIVGEPVERDVGEKRNVPFTISGEASKRGILWKELPQYPEGLQTEATLKFKFFVLPDGSVHNITPLFKGAPQLEEITIEALHKWKFTPLPPTSQETQEGVITFIYKLE